MKKGIIILLFLITIINYSSAEAIIHKNEEIVIDSFKESKSKFKSFNVSYNGKISDKFIEFKDLDQISKEITESIEVEEDYREVTQESKMNRISIYGQVDGNKNITLVFYSYLDQRDGKSKTTVFIDINESKDYAKLEETTRKVSKALEKQKIKAKITSCIVGSYKGKLRSEYKVEIVKNLIKRTKSIEVESLNNNDLISYSLYTKNIDNYIYSGRKKINLNIAINYDEYRDQTNIFIASPIITMGY